MNKVYQTDETCETGNCLAACIASILEVPLEEVPSPEKNISAQEDWDEYFIKLLKYLRKHGLGLISITENPGVADHLKIKGYKIGIFSNKNSNVRHAVVMLGNRVVHDPSSNPIKRKKKDLEWYDVLYKTGLKR